MKKLLSRSTLIFVALLLAALSYRFHAQWGQRLFVSSQRPTPQQAANRFCDRIASWSDPAFVVKRMPGRPQARLVVSDFHGRSLVQTNLALCRLAAASGLQPLAATEDRKRASLSLVFGTDSDSLVWISIQQKQRQDFKLPARPQLALVAYCLPPENSRSWHALLKRAAVRTLIADQPLRTAGRDVLIALPLEPIGYPQQDPGPGTILLDDSDIQLRTKLVRFLKYAPKPAGFAASQGSRALKDQRVTSAVMRFCTAEHLLFLEPRFTANSLARESARANGCRYLTATAYVEQKTSAKSAAAMLAKALVEDDAFSQENAHPA